MTNCGGNDGGTLCPYPASGQCTSRFGHRCSRRQNVIDQNDQRRRPRPGVGGVKPVSRTQPKCPRQVGGPAGRREPRLVSYPPRELQQGSPGDRDTGTRTGRATGDLPQRRQRTPHQRRHMVDASRAPRCSTGRHRHQEQLARRGRSRRTQQRAHRGQCKQRVDQRQREHRTDIAPPALFVGNQQPADPSTVGRRSSTGGQPQRCGIRQDQPRRPASELVTALHTGRAGRGAAGAAARK
jgi:hypothetical protein